ncbi:hypothetical protein ROLI_042690 [Roseobacter fucihabitans]|uniref:Uncharacterized protein n=1 Tax=Roseobacter fucihabitans TaxID=1537242 RepID=A0ABZ2BYY0_9RHOB
MNETENDVLPRHRWNPLSTVRRVGDFQIEDLQRLAEVVSQTFGALLHFSAVTFIGQPFDISFKV